MNKLSILNAIPPLLAAAMLGSAATAYIMGNPGTPGLLLFYLPLVALAMDQFFFKRIDFQVPGSAPLNLFSYLPRIGFLLVILAAFAFHLWLATAPKDWEPFTFYSKLSVLTAAIGLIALGSTFGKMRPGKYFGNLPWLNQSSLAFRKKKRMDGWAFVLIGMLAIVINLWNPFAAKYFMLYTLILEIPLSLGYSHYIWKHDPDRTPVPVKP